jgi:DNA-binding MarR family transcriptional regulator
MATRRTAVDFSTAADRDAAVKIGAAWRGLRRGATNAAVRDYFYGNETETLDAGQMDTLDVLVHRPSWRMSDLAEALRVDPSTATRAVQRLLKENLAERNADADDGRVVIVRATDEGRRLHQRVDERRGYVITKLMSAFTVSERADLADLLTRFVRELDDLVKELPKTEGATSDTTDASSAPSAQLHPS